MAPSCAHLRTRLPTRSLAVLLLVAAWVPCTGAQPTLRLETGFERDVNRYRWTADADVVRSLDAWELRATNRFVSDAFALFNDRLGFRDENQLAWLAARPLSDRFRLRLQGRTAWFNQSRVFSQEVYAGIRYAAGTYAWVEPAVGLAWDHRPGVSEAGSTPPLRRDRGPAYAVRLDVAPPQVDGYDLRLRAAADWQAITPRRGRAFRIDGTATRSFSGTLLAAELGFSSLRRDAYQAASFLNRDEPADRLPETVEATTSDTLWAAFSLDVPFQDGFRLSSRLSFNANDRLIRTLGAPSDALYFDTDFNRLALDLEAGLLYEKPRLMARLGVRGSAETEERLLANRDDLPPIQAAQKTALLRQADYERSYFALQARSRFAPTSAVAFSFDGTASILRHDTPAVNPDDRDEVYHNGRAGVLLRLSRYVETDVQLFGTYYHTIYLNAARSAENNVQRSLRLRPTVRWTPSRRTDVRFSAEVRATYTVDDFVLPGRRRTDQSAREFRYDADGEHRFGQGLVLRASGSLSDLRLGRLLWDEFAEIPFDTLRTYSGWVRLQAGRRITAEVGLRLFIRSDFDQSVLVRYPRLDANGTPMKDETGAVLLSSITRPGRRRIEQLGPTCAVTWPLGNASLLRLDGWLTVQHIRRHLYGDLPEASAAVIRLTGRRGTRTIIPNVLLTVRWNF